MWKKLSEQFQKKTWANKLRKLYSLKLKDGDSVHKHIKSMTEIFNELSVIGVDMTEEDRVVHLLASLPESYNTLVTALEASSEVPKMDVVTEKLLYEEGKRKDRVKKSEEALPAHHSFSSKHRRGPRCHFCHKLGHIQRNCTARAKSERKQEDYEESKEKKTKHRANQVKSNCQRKDESDSNSEFGMVTRHVLSASSSHQSTDAWLIDSGATCHICNNRELFIQYQTFKTPQKVSVGDGYTLEAVGSGIVALTLELPDHKTKKCKLHEVLYVPKLTYNLLSVSKMTDAEKHITFSDDECFVYNENEELLAVATKTGSLYHLICYQSLQEEINAVRKHESKENRWHRRFGHLGEKYLRELAQHNLVNGFDYNLSNVIDFCEPCVSGKLHRSPFPTTGRKRADTVLGLVHSDVCGKLSTLSLGGASYFLTFVDDRSHYTWVYVLKHMSEVLQKFKEWKALVETSSGHQLKTLRTDNGGEYCSEEFEKFCEKGVRHERTVPKTPEQNGVAERMNRTLIETIRSMIADSKLPKSFWAEALSTAVYVRNRSPTKAVNGMTPFEAWTGKKPSVDHLRTFGCISYAHIPKDERKKLDSKARKTILLGYGNETKGYRLYDLTRSRVIHSRDVLFDESTRGIEKEEINEQEPSMVSLNEEEQMLIDDLSEEETRSEPENVTEPEPESETRRSTRESDRYGVWVNATTVSNDEPMSVREALNCPEEKQWRQARDEVYAQE